jgi:hypothetical protein
MPISEFDKAHIGDIIADVGGKEYNWFTCHLLQLINKADFENRQLLRKVYPVEVKEYERWYISTLAERNKR